MGVKLLHVRAKLEKPRTNSATPMVSERAVHDSHVEFEAARHTPVRRQEMDVAQSEDMTDFRVLSSRLKFTLPLKS